MLQYIYLSSNYARYLLFDNTHFAPWQMLVDVSVVVFYMNCFFGFINGFNNPLIPVPLALGTFPLSTNRGPYLEYPFPLQFSSLCFFGCLFAFCFLSFLSNIVDIVHFPLALVSSFLDEGCEFLRPLKSRARFVRCVLVFVRFVFGSSIQGRFPVGWEGLGTF